MEEKLNFKVPTLGKATIPSPLQLSSKDSDFIADYVSDDQCIIYDTEVTADEHHLTIHRDRLMERAGPRSFIYFDPSKVHAAIVTCGGLCPGLNNVIRSIVFCLWYQYGVRRITGIQYGYRGFLPDSGFPTVELNPDAIMNIHREGGSIIGASRGYGDRIPDLVDAIERMNLNMLFIIGGDGSQRGALKIYQEISNRNLKIAVIGIPKTIDNDLSFVQRSFGFETAFSFAVQAVTGAHVEAHDSINGIAVVKVMGRDSGFIAAHTSLATNDVNFVLIPEVPFDLSGENGLFIHLERRLKERNHALIVIAEGAGANLIASSTETDASGNKKYNDIGLFLKNEIQKYFTEKKTEINLKYIDPSYIIRSQPANPSDAIYCSRLGNNAVHAGMAGKTGALISLLNDHFVQIPIQLSVSRKNKIAPDSSLWRAVIEATGQPFIMRNQ